MILMNKSFYSFLILPVILFAQPDEIQFEYLSVDDGLSSSYVRCIAQDQSGFIWFGTGNGLNKYDGYNFTSFTHSPFDTSGIGDNIISALCVDRSGYLWIGTNTKGLVYYDHLTESFRSFRHDPDNPNSISDNNILSLCQDKNGSLWIGTGGGGVNQLIYNPDSLNYQKTLFKRYYHDPSNQNSIAGNWINDIFEDSNGFIWIGTGNGLSRLLINKKNRVSIKNYTYNAHDPYCLSYNSVSAISEDEYGNLWIGTSGGGLNRLSLENERFYHYRNEPGNQFSLSQDNISTIQIDNNHHDILWIGTQIGGINRLNIMSGKIKRYGAVHEHYLYRKNYTIDMFQDASGLLWIVGWGGGLLKFDPQRDKFKKYLPGFGLGKEEVIWSFYENPNSTRNIIWLISAVGGLLKFDRTRGTFKRYLTDPNHPDYNLRNMMMNLYGEPKLGNSSASLLWLGSYTNGLMLFDCETEKFKYISEDPNHIFSQIKSQVRSFYPDPQDEDIVWIGTNSDGLYKYNKKNSILKHYTHQPNNPNSLSNPSIHHIMRDRAGNLWISTIGGGLNRMNEMNESFIHYKHNPADTNSISHNWVYITFESSFGTLWIGTRNGLNKFYPEKNLFYHYSQEDGLPSDVVLGILEDKHGYLWLGTSRGLSRFNPKTRGTNAFRNYYVADGLHGNDFSNKGFFQSESGEIYGGGIRGFTIFHPDSIKDNTYKPPIVLTDFYLFDKQVKPGNNSPLKYSISHTSEILLDYNKNSLTFEFSALDYLNPLKNQYAYRMEGIDQDWIYTDASRRFATYTQLDPGEYTFRVKGSNNDGIWNEEGTSIKITITPPWWRTNFAYVVYFLIIALTLYTLRTYDKKRQRLKHDLELEHLHAEKLEEVDRMKSRFFANISHEFRTPLTLILGPLQSILAKIRDIEFKKELKLILRNATRLEHLVNQLLDLSRLESGKLNLQVEQVDLIPLLRKMVLAFTSLAERKKIILKFRSKAESLPAYIDKDKIEKIINNLLSNAFKFTPEGGRITVAIAISSGSNHNVIPAKAGIHEKIWIPHQVRDDNEEKISNIKYPTSNILKITVSNTGPGIPADKINRIFDRFYQVDDSYTRDHEGTGIGLSLVKELVELHHGTIDVHCKGSGSSIHTIFTIQLPLDREQYTDEEIFEVSSISEKIPIEKIPDELPLLTHGPEESEDVRKVSVKDEKPLILLIEDNPDMRQYIRENLQDCYNILEADDGREGWNLALKAIPDLVVSDIMMPKMDGFQVCEKIKSDIHTSHIPVLLLTARAEVKDKIRGLETGADDYISKPFVIEEMKVRVKNLIEQRQKLRERFSREALFGVKDITLTEHDEKFLEHAMETINQHIDDPHFTVQKLGDSVGMSRTTLHLKLKALTGQSPHNFIRLLRLKKAAILLQQKTISVSEVAYEVGFKNLSHFAKAFQEQFGETPSHFASHH